MANPNFYRAADTISRNRHSAMHVCRHILCQLKASGRHQMEYTILASATALRMSVATLATSRMESCQSCLGSNPMPGIVGRQYEGEL